MKILVTGLCIARNLGGPAMGLTLINEIRKKYPEAEFIFAISPIFYKMEKQWADYYGVQIVQRDTLFTYITEKLRIKKLYYLLTGQFSKLKNHLGSAFWLKVHDEFMGAYYECDVVIDMSGISYVGDGGYKFASCLSDYSTFYYAKKNKKPFVRFVQSYGPFDDWKVRFIAKKEFNKLPFIIARGKQSAEYCRKIVKNKEKVFDSPDIAILLPLEKENWVQTFLNKFGYKTKEYSVLSPSAVIYAMPKSINGSIGDKHIISFAIITKELIKRNEKILFLPHMYSEDKKECDREVCFKILEILKKENIDLKNVKVVYDDLDAIQAKTIIANSKFAIVSRYHALVAAISTSTPVVAIGWNLKYYDLMEYYDIQKMSIDIRNYKPEELAQQVFERIKFYETESIQSILIEKQQVNKIKVQGAFNLLFNWLEDKISRGESMIE